MENKELIEALHNQSVALDAVAKMSYLNYMQEQTKQQNKIPSNILWGSFGFNPTGVSTNLAQWREIAPRNPRRRRISFFGQNISFYFAANDTVYDINSLIKAQASGASGYLPVALVTLTPNYTFDVDSTDSIWVASLTGGGSTVEQTGVLNWKEEIYSEVSASVIPSKQGREFNIPGQVQKLSREVQALDGDQASEYNREGIR